MTNPDLVSRVARAIEQADNQRIPDGHANGYPDDISDWGLWVAQAALREVLEVLKEPTAAQLAASVTRVGNPSDRDREIAAEAVKMLGSTDANIGIGIVVASEVARDFRNMLAASPLTHEASNV